jgi:GMP synthase (glutamine-hydrolysing)
LTFGGGVAAGEPLPDRLADHDGVVVFGGPLSANDTLDWVRREIKWLEPPLAEDKPLLGLCVGAQMLARGCSATTTSVARLAITRSSPRRG